MFASFLQSNLLTTIILYKTRIWKLCHHGRLYWMENGSKWRQTGFKDVTFLLALPQLRWRRMRCVEHDRRSSHGRSVDHKSKEKKPFKKHNKLNLKSGPTFQLCLSILQCTALVCAPTVLLYSFLTKEIRNFAFQPWVL